MAPVVSRFDREAFLALPLFLKQLEVIEDIQFCPILEKLSPVFVKFAVQQKFGPTIIHRHFDLEEDEIVVEVENQAKTGSISMPWTYDARNGIAVPKDPAFLSSEGIELTNAKTIVPRTWSFSPDGDLIPLEFQGTNEKFEQPSPAFLKDVFEILKNLGLLHVFGITRLGEEERSYETTDEDRRINFIDYQLSDTGEGFTNVTWRFDKDGGFSESGSCNGFNHGRECRHCRHCMGHGHSRACRVHGR